MSKKVFSRMIVILEMVEKEKNMSNKTKHLYLIISMLAILIVPVYLYGIRPIIVMAIGIGTAIIMDMICRIFFKTARKKFDLSSIVCAMAMALMLPACVDYYVIVVAVVTGLLIAKYPFGGTDHMIFHPAALGLATVAISFPEQVFSFPAPQTKLGLAASLNEQAQIIYSSSPASILNVGGTPKISYFDLLLGNFAGATGATCILVLVLILLFLMVRRVVAYQLVFSCLATVVIYATLFPRVATGTFNSIVFELTSGILLFGVTFLLSEPATVPQTGFGQVFYGFVLAICVMLFRTVGSLDVEFVFVLLFTNALSKEFDKLGYFLVRRIKGEASNQVKAGDSNI